MTKANVEFPIKKHQPCAMAPVKWMRWLYCYGTQSSVIYFIQPIYSPKFKAYNDISNSKQHLAYFMATYGSNSKFDALLLPKFSKSFI